MLQRADSEETGGREAHKNPLVRTFVERSHSQTVGMNAGVLSMEPKITYTFFRIGDLLTLKKRWSFTQGLEDALSD